VTSIGTGRGQLSLSLIEALVGALLVVAVATGFALGGPDLGGTREAQLDRYAEDSLALLAADDPGPRSTEDDRSTLVALVASEDSFERAREPARRRLATVLPANLLFRVETPHGNIGYPNPPGRTVGEARRVTIDGTITVRVWSQ
jgi:hypothetical protein